MIKIMLGGFRPDFIIYFGLYLIILECVSKVTDK